MTLQWLQSVANEIHVVWFVLLGSVIEEIIAPIPSPLVLTLAGSISATQGRSILFLIGLALIGAISKTLGSWLMYILADKAEDIIIGKFGKLLGLSQSDTEGLGKFLTKTTRSDVAVFILRSVPIMPTAPVSLIAGLIKMEVKSYLLGTFFGLLVRNMIYLYFGYVSLGAIESLSTGFESMEKIGYLILSVIGGVSVIWLYRRRQKSSGLDVIQDALVGVQRVFRRK